MVEIMVEIILIFLCVLSYIAGRKQKELEQKDKEDTAIMTHIIKIKDDYYEIKKLYNDDGRIKYGR